MIATLRGEIAQVEENALVLEVGGVGLRVFVPNPLRTRMKAGDALQLYTHLVVREDALTLYGFESQAERELFNTLLGVDGVGPKAALSILSLGDSEVVRNALANGDVAFITKAGGVGKRIAERVVVDLQDKVGLPLRTNVSLAGSSEQILHSDEALEALMALGYNLADATRALEGVSTDLSTAERVTQALKQP